jgi:hypothetical protein
MLDLAGLGASIYVESWHPKGIGVNFGCQTDQMCFLVLFN